MIVVLRSILKKEFSDFAGMIEVVIGIVPVPIDAVKPPIFS